MSGFFSSHRPVVMGTHWMMTADHPLAAQAGAEVLARGGRAADAVVAANLVLCVARPHMCGPGGDLWALCYDAAEDKVYCLNASGRAPARATLEAYHALGLTAMPEVGIYTATVPGAIDGWKELLARQGSQSLADLAGPAVDYAKNGFPVYPELTEAIREVADIMDAQPAARASYLPGGRPPRPGELLHQPALAHCLETLARAGSEAFYSGELGRALVRHSGKLGGFFDLEDLENHRSDWVEPLTAPYRGLTLATQPPNSQGMALLLSAMILDKLGLDGLEPGGAEHLHRMVEAKKLAFADRDRYAVDPAFHPTPLDQLLDPLYARDRAALVDPHRAAKVREPGDFTLGGHDTVYLSAVDSKGNAVALIQSIYLAFGSGVMVPETGMFLHNRGRGFSLDPKSPACLMPGKRPYHTLHNCMVLREGRPVYLLGSPGADGQPQTVMQMAANLLVFGADVQQTVEAPRFRSDPDGILNLESRISREAMLELEKRGHRIRAGARWDDMMGSAQALFIDRERGVLQAGADPRRQAYAVGA